jgi:predicted nucleotidyltransferase
MTAISASPLAAEITAALKAVAESDRHFLGVTVCGSAATGTSDEFSDLDFVIVCRDGDEAAILTEARSLAGRLGPLLGIFTGEHVGERRLVIALYGPPLLHVDLKFVSLGDLSKRVEDGLVVWERDGAVTAALSNSKAVWPTPDLQWIEDRFWIWIHYGATKLGRGELFECLDMLNYLRSAVFGPLVAVDRGHRPQGVRRIEASAPDIVPRLAATVASHSRASCAAALQAAVELYRDLRDSAPNAHSVVHSQAEAAALEYLTNVIRPFRPGGPAEGT